MYKVKKPMLTKNRKSKISCNYCSIIYGSIVSRASGPKATSAEAHVRANRTGTTQKQAIQKNHPPTGLELSVFRIAWFWVFAFLVALSWASALVTFGPEASKTIEHLFYIDLIYISCRKTCGLCNRNYEIT